MNDLGLSKQTKKEELLEQTAQHPGIFFVQLHPLGQKICNRLDEMLKHFAGRWVALHFY